MPASCVTPEPTPDYDPTPTTVAARPRKTSETEPAKEKSLPSPAPAPASKPPEKVVSPSPAARPPPSHKPAIRTEKPKAAPRPQSTFTGVRTGSKTDVSKPDAPPTTSAANTQAPAASDDLFRNVVLRKTQTNTSPSTNLPLTSPTKDDKTKGEVIPRQNEVRSSGRNQRNDYDNVILPERTPAATTDAASKPAARSHTETETKSDVTRATTKSRSESESESRKADDAAVSASKSEDTDAVPAQSPTSGVVMRKKSVTQDADLKRKTFSPMSTSLHGAAQLSAASSGTSASASKNPFSEVRLRRRSMGESGAPQQLSLESGSGSKSEASTPQTAASSSEQTSSPQVTSTSAPSGSEFSQIFKRFEQRSQRSRKVDIEVAKTAETPTAEGKPDSKPPKVDTKLSKVDTKPTEVSPDEKPKPVQSSDSFSKLRPSSVRRAPLKPLVDANPALPNRPKTVFISPKAPLEENLKTVSPAIKPSAANSGSATSRPRTILLVSSNGDTSSSASRVASKTSTPTENEAIKSRFGKKQLIVEEKSSPTTTAPTASTAPSRPSAITRTGSGSVRGAFKQNNSSTDSGAAAFKRESPGVKDRFRNRTLPEINSQRASVVADGSAGGQESNQKMPAVASSPFSQRSKSVGKGVSGGLTAPSKKTEPTPAPNTGSGESDASKPAWMKLAQKKKVESEKKTQEATPQTTEAPAQNVSDQILSPKRNHEFLYQL